jgi:hypothetical protein
MKCQIGIVAIGIAVWPPGRVVPCRCA